MKVAVYTSPHLNDFRERIRLNGSLVSKEAVVESTRLIREVYDPERTTFFEFTTAVAFHCIAETRPDIAVVEVGLGGRLDATNTIEPLATVITDISREHEDYLGEGIASVAREKAGIIKHRIPVITGASREAARQVILSVARDAQAPVSLFGRDFVGKRSALSQFDYTSDGMSLESLEFAMGGGHQIKNASLACRVLEELRKRGFAISDSAIREGIRKTRFPGRFELLKTRPDVIIDGAHTPESMRLLRSTLRQHYPGIRPLVLLGMLKEKNFREMAAIIGSVAREVVCVRPQGNRAMDPEELAEEVAKLGLPVHSVEHIVNGFRLLEGKASRDDLILATGSLYMIGPVRRACGLEES